MLASILYWFSLFTFSWSGKATAAKGDGHCQLVRAGDGLEQEDEPMEPDEDDEDLRDRETPDLGDKHTWMISAWMIVWCLTWGNLLHPKVVGVHTVYMTMCTVSGCAFWLILNLKHSL